ncbi:MAG: hypothetical protein KDA44_17265 [Planctomycetales bacterium]|nr:hypothetical protein [Planctomycetales bacterium]
MRLGARRGIPTLVLIREPRDAVLSLTIRKELPSVVWALEEYLDFYLPVAALADGVVVADFTETTADMGAVIRRLNDRFGTNFAEFDHNEENVAAVYAELEQIEQRDAGGDVVRETHVARPSAARRSAKDDLASQLESQPAQRLLAEAQTLYEMILQQHGIRLPDPQEATAH